MYRRIKQFAKRILLHVPYVKDVVYGHTLYKKYARNGGEKTFLIKNRSRFYFETAKRNKLTQLSEFLDKIEIGTIENDSFIYNVDCYKGMEHKAELYGNYTVDYDMAINGFLDADKEATCVLSNHFERYRRSGKLLEKHGRQLDAIGSLFQRPAESVFEGLQRVLFYNQLLWQTGHTLNGLGHLDWLLDDLYRRDMEAGAVTRESVAELIKDFFRALHEYYRFKSASVIGDTGQIIIIGGRNRDGRYCCNDLTYLFIEVSKELRLPDPKVLLRCTADMPEDLLELAVDCIATGIGAPLLANDDEIIPAMLSCGYDAEDAYNYGTSACWEPLIPGLSFEPNNIASLNFAVPFTRMANQSEFDAVDSTEEVISLYEDALREYIREILTPLTVKQFEPDPLLSLLSPSCMEQRRDITRGGAKYNNLGLTSVGLGSVVNSILNLDKMVFAGGSFKLKDLNEARKENFFGRNELVEELKSLSPAFGSDAEMVVALTKRLIAFTSEEFKRYKTPYGGVFKFGLSSPSYISGANSVPATFDGRRDGEPFSVHISSASALPTTELISFATKLDYRENRINGNVIDFIISPGMLKENRGKYAALLRAGLKGGIFELQVNVVDSKTLIAAKADPTLFPNLVVRVWGFSAYFNDLPEEYKDVLIKRAVESEKAA